MKFFGKIALFLLIFQLNSSAFAQKKQERIQIVHSDSLLWQNFNQDTVAKLIGNVHLIHGKTHFYCDTALNFQSKNEIRAYSNIKIVPNDSVTVRGEELFYDGKTKIAELFRNVKMTNGSAVLSTQKMYYYRDKNYGEYINYGKLVDGDNVLTSVYGSYYPDRSMAFFENDVKLINQKKDFELITDTLGYNTFSKFALFLDKTYIFYDSSEVYTEDGFYDTENKISMLYKNPYILDSSYYMEADTIFYDQIADSGYASCNIKVSKTDTSADVFGEFSIFKRKQRQTFITDHPYAIQRFEEDTLYLFADTLFAIDDTISDIHQLQAYHKVEFLMRSAQGKSDSLVYFSKDSLLTLYYDPILWNKANQLTGDTISMFVKGKSIDSLVVLRNSFIVSQADSVGYNQIKGKNLFAKFKKNEIHKLWVKGNTENIYFDKTDSVYKQMNKSFSNELYAEFEENKPVKIALIGNVDGEVFPIFMVYNKQNLLKGFVWRVEERPSLEDSED